MEGWHYIFYFAHEKKKIIYEKSIDHSCSTFYACSMRQ